MELRRRGVQDLASSITAIETLIEFKKESFTGQNEKISGRGQGGETRTSLLGATCHPHQETKGGERRMRHRGSTHASYTMDLNESSSVQNEASLRLLSKTRRGKRRKGRELL